jgi:uncharacterized RDD family membrane protein YckC
MVLHDLHAQKPEPKNGLKIRTPALIDRMACTSIDFICFFFIAFIVLSPLRREMTIARLTESSSDFAASYSLSLLVFAMLSVLYQGLFVGLKGATPGMMALKLRVVKVNSDEAPDWSAALLRGAMWTLSGALAFLPHIGILTNARRRPFHDRVADTDLVSLNGKWGGEPTLHAKNAMTGFVVGLALLGVFGLVTEVGRMSRMANDLKDWREELESVSTASCRHVEDAEENWEADFQDQVPSRLSLALALFSANTLEDECLSIEAFRAFKSGREIELAYLAKSFYHSDDAELSDQYLQKVCELAPSSDACKFSKMIEVWAEQSETERPLGNENQFFEGPLFAKIWAIKHFERIKEFESELKLIDSLWPQKYIAGFLGAHRSVALWGLHRREEARMALLSTIENMEAGERVELASWFCYRELAESCESLSQPSCKVFMDFAGASSSRLPAANLLVSYVRAQECKTKSLDFQDLTEKASGDSAFSFLAALEDLQNGKLDKALDVLKPMSDDPRWDKAFREEASRRLILTAKESEEFADIIAEWEQGDTVSWEWRNEGLQLLKRLRDLKLFDLAFAVGEELLKHQALDTENRQNLAIMAYSNGFKRQALGFLGRRDARLPASPEAISGMSRRQKLDEEYYHVRESLLNEFKEEFSR